MLTDLVTLFAGGLGAGAIIGYGELVKTEKSFREVAKFIGAFILLGIFADLLRDGRMELGATTESLSLAVSFELAYFGFIIGAGIGVLLGHKLAVRKGWTGPRAEASN